ncbi:hypothetical protein [Amycolatopsis cihanbeyliensis]|uniref:Uncharacterized protein n=1 Tax=Amycolatopsis cihanbeyliensis TaxID=1128664 RepID=A0A542DMI0_AMYCI|nr:hypothetical protein [Amycolatopsis cihanbeyliensis]TQJ04289.1 hypothetical protein FB471_4075 [Amycolatopsis cihanbeyliensis]
MPALEYHGPKPVTGTDVATMDRLPLVEPQATDTTLYGDQISTLRRVEAIWGETLSPGYLTAWAMISPKTLTASVLTFCVFTAHSGLATFDFGIYTGPDLTTLTQRASTFSLDWIATPGVKSWTLPNPITLTKGEAVAMCGVTTGSGTAPRLASTTPGGSTLINETPYSVYQGGQSYPLPETLNLHHTRWTRANQKFWFALR